MNISFVPVRDIQFTTELAPTVFPKEDEVAIVGRFDSADFEIESIRQIAVESPDGTCYPLTIEKDSLFLEFGSIVAVRFFFTISTSTLQEAEEGWRIVWGEDVSSENTEILRIILDPSSRERFREFRWNIERGGSDSSSVATIEVIAESGAEYYFLWYLLPMGLLFAILTIRKMRASGAGPKPVI